MPVPEAPMNKDDFLAARKDKIGGSGEIAAVEPVPEPHGMDQPPNG